MPGISRVTTDTAGGTIVGALVPSVRVNSTPVAVIGAPVQPHAPPLTPHSGGPVMAEGSATVFAGGIPVCRAGDAASCGHAATGSATVFAGG